MKSHSRQIPVILAISHEITQQFANFSLKIAKVGKIVIQASYDSCKCWKVKSCSHSIHVTFDHDPSLQLPEIVVDGILGQFDCKFSNRKWVLSLDVDTGGDMFASFLKQKERTKQYWKHLQ